MDAIKYQSDMLTIELIVESVKLTSFVYVIGDKKDNAFDIIADVVAVYCMGVDIIDIIESSVIMKIQDKAINDYKEA